ncbi:MAG: type II toxin-antitoxin system RelE/ParE family toxin [Verrucomicrobiae bacterium]|nr:type II toxin-antitoxin system RelE/ParE family toxin [Verrucomicrobiae bacterium]
MIVKVMATAEEDLWSGFSFYDQQEPGLGDCFLRALRSDITGLRLTVGIHSKKGKLWRVKSKKFPRLIYYVLKENIAYVLMVIDARQDPSKIPQREKKKKNFRKHSANTCLTYEESASATNFTRILK